MDILRETPLFAEADLRQRFPSPIAVTLEVMVSEIEESGEVTTADELAAAIEATFLWLGRVWIAEYLHAVERDGSLADEQINQELVERASSPRSPTTGRWVGLARAIRSQLSGTQTVIDGLSAIEFGDTTGRLLDFRNHFSHGSFASTLDGIRENRALLHELLSSVPALWTQAALCREPETGSVRAASGAWPVVEDPTDGQLLDGHPTIVGLDGALLDLYPLMHVASAPGGLMLASPNKAHPISTLTERAALATWLARYVHHQRGYLPYESVSQSSDCPAELIERVAAGIAGLVLVEAYPGCRGGSVVAALTPDDPCQLGLSEFDAIRRVCVAPNDLGQSGLTLARVVLRLVEEALGEESGSRQASAAALAEPNGPLQAALADLSNGGKRALLGIENIHNGVTAYRGEPLTVLDVYGLLADSAVTVVASAVPGVINRPLFDQKIEVSVPAEVDALDVGQWVEHLTAGRALHGRVLDCLVSGEPAHLFTLCDALEKKGNDTVFEPAVERALWDLRPLLQWTRTEIEDETGQTERVRVWAPFAPAVAQVVTARGGQA